MKKLSQFFLLLACLAAATVIAGLLVQKELIWQPAAVIAIVSFALGMGNITSLKSFRYTAWIIVAVVVAMIYPSAFTHWGNIDLRNKWLILVIVQMVMFGMGIQMSLKDFSGIATTGKGVAVGLLCHFSIMPLMGLMLTKIFHFDPEIAAGIILIGSCSSGLASNVMVYLARANLVLSVVVTALSTLAAPFLTPLLMKLLAGTLIEVKFVNMMMEIIKIVIVPIGAALLHDFLKTATAKNWKVVKTIFVFSVLWLFALAIGLSSFFPANISSNELQQSIEIFSFFTGAFVIGVLYHLVAKRYSKVDSFLPYLSMFGIVYFTTVTTAAGRDNLLQVGFILFFCSVIHNAAGYFFGYWLSRLFGLDKPSSRTIAFEVGLQNGGMASGLAGSMGKLGTVGLPAAVFSPWMNISGSILANYWRKKSLQENKLKTTKETTETGKNIAAAQKRTVDQ
jgi:BASS family bile acid:Na+ symporter